MQPTLVSFKNPALDWTFRARLTHTAHDHGDRRTWTARDRAENKLALVQTERDRALVFCPDAGFAWVFSDALTPWTPSTACT